MGYYYSDTFLRAIGYVDPSEPEVKREFQVHDGMGNPAGYRAGPAFCDEVDQIRAQAWVDHNLGQAEQWKVAGNGMREREQGRSQIVGLTDARLGRPPRLRRLR
jgi:hypothetical protein